MFSERTEESSAVQYFQVGTRHPLARLLPLGGPWEAVQHRAGPPGFSFRLCP